MSASPKLDTNPHLGVPSQTTESETLGSRNLMLQEVLTVILMQFKASDTALDCGKACEHLGSSQGSSVAGDRWHKSSSVV